MSDRRLCPFCGQFRVGVNTGKCDFCGADEVQIEVARNLKNGLSKLSDDFAALRAENERLREELAVDEKLLSARTEIFDLIPDCPEHGKGCLVHMGDWIRSRLKDAAELERLRADMGTQKKNMLTAWAAADIEHAKELEALRGRVEMARGLLEHVIKHEEAFTGFRSGPTELSQKARAWLAGADDADPFTEAREIILKLGRLAFGQFYKDDEWLTTEDDDDVRQVSAWLAAHPGKDETK
jgi:hypothetical protein